MFYIHKLLLVVCFILAGCSARGDSQINKNNLDFSNYVSEIEWRAKWGQIKRQFQSLGVEGPWVDATYSSKLPRHLEGEDGVVFYASLDHVLSQSSIYVLTDPAVGRVKMTVLWNWPTKGMSTTVEIVD